MKNSFTILLVEDDANDALLLQRAIKKNGINTEIQVARDGLDAVAYLSAKEPFTDRAAFPFPDVVILDLKMPRMSGLELLAWINEHSEFRVIPTIVMSSSKQSRDVEEAYRLGANTYMVKPNDFDALAKMIRTIYDYWLLSVRPRIDERL